MEAEDTAAKVADTAVVEDTVADRVDTVAVKVDTVVARVATVVVRADTATNKVDTVCSFTTRRLIPSARRVSGRLTGFSPSLSLLYSGGGGYSEPSS